MLGISVQALHTKGPRKGGFLHGPRWNDHDAKLVVRHNNVFHFLDQRFWKAMFVNNGDSKPRLVRQDNYRLWQVGYPRACMSKLPSKRVRGAVNHRRTKIGPVKGHGLSADHEIKLVPAYW